MSYFNSIQGPGVNTAFHMCSAINIVPYFWLLLSHIPRLFSTVSSLTWKFTGFTRFSFHLQEKLFMLLNLNSLLHCACTLKTSTISFWLQFSLTKSKVSKPGSFNYTVGFFSKYLLLAVQQSLIKIQNFVDYVWTDTLSPKLHSHWLLFCQLIQGLS